MKKILQVTTYSLDSLDHGGKIRSYNIREKLRECFHVETLSFEFCENELIDNFNVKLNKDHFLSNIGHGYLMDWGINTYLSESQAFKLSIADKVAAFEPSIILLEQPFLWPLIEDFIRLGFIDDDVFIIYSSHNNEVELKKDIYRSIFDDEAYSYNISYVKNLEESVINSADLCLAVSQADIDFIRSVNNSASTYLFPNGHSGISSGSAECVDKWKGVFSESKYNWVFVGSWHEPNIDGLLSLLHAGLKDIDPNEVRLWVFGGAGDGLAHAVDLSENSSVKIMGWSDVEDIDSAILSSSGVVLPIWAGGGSNLKTVQALLSGKAVIASKYSFRGFEQYLGLDGVFVADSPDEFISKMGFVCERQYSREEASRNLRWESILECLPRLVMSFVD